ncbi:hypothetical protein BJY00DRAFT_84726 [Aspergillus carlsbadensis]|nr:hypothetical protein BJY00DRAFT_84726 [Aspergillus carlsbadensis]
MHPPHFDYSTAGSAPSLSRKLTLLCAALKRSPIPPHDLALLLDAWSSIFSIRLFSFYRPCHHCAAAILAVNRHLSTKELSQRRDSKILDDRVGWDFPRYSTYIIAWYSKENPRKFAKRGSRVTIDGGKCKGAGLDSWSGLIGNQRNSQDLVHQILISVNKKGIKAHSNPLESISGSLEDFAPQCSLFFLPSFFVEALGDAGTLGQPGE